MVHHQPRFGERLAGFGARFGNGLALFEGYGPGDLFGTRTDGGKEALHQRQPVEGGGFRPLPLRCGSDRASPCNLVRARSGIASDDFGRPRRIAGFERGAGRRRPLPANKGGEFVFGHCYSVLTFCIRSRLF
jgi:hypothetical protein